MAEIRHVAVIDIGKTNAKIALVDLSSQTELAVLRRPNFVVEKGPYPHFDIEGLWGFFLEGLKSFQSKYGVDGISVTTHGACAALLDSTGKLATPVLDYEYSAIQNAHEAYRKIRPDFVETGSPELSNGLNLGAQLFWLFQHDPSLFDRTTTILTYPQYWVFRLTGVAASDVSSLGCHTDIWNPYERDYSSLVDTLAIREKLAEPRNSNEIIGYLLPEICAQTGLGPNTPVVCGIHDSNASLFPYLKSKSKPFSVVSSGTWVIAMAVGHSGAKPVEKNETFVNVDAFGCPVPSARFMGGREFELMKSLVGDDYKISDVREVLEQDIMLLPAVEANAGPFRGRQHKWLPQVPNEEAPHRTVALSFYLALVTAICLETIGHRGEVIVEGPFAQNELFLSMLCVATNSTVFISSGQTGTSLGAAQLFSDMTSTEVRNTEHIADNSMCVAAMREYAQTWRTLSLS